jgi:hypothetical protein
MRAWLRDHGQMTNRDAAERVKTAKRLRAFPVTREAWEAGVLSQGQVTAIVTNVKDRTAELYADAETGLVPDLARLGVTDTAGVMQEWAKHAEAVADENNPPDPAPNRLHHSTTLDGRGEMSGSFDTEGNAIIDRALEEAMPAYDRDDPMDLAERRATAMVEIMRDYLNTHEQPKGRRNRPHLALVIGIDQFANGGPGHTSDGAIIDHCVVRMLSCDANLHRVTVDANGTILDYGRATRTVSPDLFSALGIRDAGCRWPGCDQPARYSEAHHIMHWSNGGQTSMNNLVLLCSGHHHLLHKGEWALVLDEETNTVTVTKTGHPPRTSRPRPHL